MKIAVPTAATAGTRIATQPIKIASTPTAIKPFQPRASPSRTSGSMRHSSHLHERTLSPHADAINHSAASPRRPPAPLPLVPANPLAHRVVGDPVFAPHRQITRRLDLGEQLLVGRALDLPFTWVGPPTAGGTVPFRYAAEPRAVIVRAVFRSELLAAVLARPPCRLPTVLPAAMGIQRGRAIGTNDLKVLESVVVRHAIDMIENQRHRATAPIFVLPALLTAALLQTLPVQAQLEAVSRVSRTRNKHLLKRNRGLLGSDE